MKFDMSDSKFTTPVAQESLHSELSERSPVPNLGEKILAIRNSLRPGQQQMADWGSGPFGYFCRSWRRQIYWDGGGGGDRDRPSI